MVFTGQLAQACMEIMGWVAQEYNGVMIPTVAMSRDNVLFVMGASWREVSAAGVSSIITHLQSAELKCVL